MIDIKKKKYHITPMGSGNILVIPNLHQKLKIFIVFIPELIGT